MSEVSSPECFVDIIDARRGKPEFVSMEFAGRVILRNLDTGLQVAKCGVEGCEATITVGGKPEANRKPWEIIEKIYDTASDNCVKLNVPDKSA